MRRKEALSCKAVPGVTDRDVRERVETEERSMWVENGRRRETPGGFARSEMCQFWIAMARGFSADRANRDPRC